MSFGMIAAVYSGPFQNGISRVYTMTKEARYRPLRSSRLIADDLYFNVQSATTYRNKSAAANIILFRSPGTGVSYVDDFTGDFWQITAYPNQDLFTSSSLNLYSVMPHAAQSILLVRTQQGRELRLSLNDTFRATAVEMLDAMLPSVATRQGLPVLTWEMWPVGIDHLSSSRSYIKLHQRLAIKPVRKTYDASFTYHIYLSLDANGKPKASVSRWAYWLEGGVLSNAIEKELAAAVELGAQTLSSTMNSMLGAIAGASFRDLYFLPGDQTGSNTLLRWGNTVDDLTVVLQA